MKTNKALGKTCILRLMLYLLMDALPGQDDGDHRHDDQVSVITWVGCGFEWFTASPVSENMCLSHLVLGVVSLAMSMCSHKPT